MGLTNGVIFKMTEKYLLFSMDDDASKKLGEVISNPTCKKIASLLAEKELTETDIASNLGIPLNTVDYNIKKLLAAGVIEKTKLRFWSVKGKRIETYKIANKLIVISPKKSIGSKIKGILPGVIISGILAFFISVYYGSTNFIKNAVQNTNEYASETTGLAAPAASKAVNLMGGVHNEWIFFVLGCLVAILALTIWNWKKL